MDYDGAYRDDPYPMILMRTHRLNEDLHRLLVSVEDLPHDPAFETDARKVLPVVSQRSTTEDWHSHHDTIAYERMLRADRTLFDLFREFDDGRRPRETES